MSEFGKRLRALRTERGLTQEELARQLGVSKSALCMYERGEREPRRETLLAIARLFGVDVRKCQYRPSWMDESRAGEMKAAVMDAMSPKASGR